MTRQEVGTDGRQLGLLTGASPRVDEAPGVSPIQAFRKVIGRLLGQVADEVLDRPARPAELWPTKESADRWT